jgi:hypothetical protein
VVNSFRTVVAEQGANRGLLISRNGFQPGAREAAKFTNIDLLTWSEFEELMFERWIGATTRRLDPLFRWAFQLMDGEQELWNLRQCTEAAWNEWERICARYTLVTIWALYLWHSKAGFIAIPSLKITHRLISNGQPLILDTYRKIVDRAPAICREARSELEKFWGITARKT